MYTARELTTVLIALFSFQWSIAKADDIEVLENAVRSFQTNDPRIIKIYENSTNRLGMESKPERWRFYVQPVLVPERDAEGNLILEVGDISTMPVRRAGKTINVPSMTIGSRIWLMRQEDRDKAVAELINVYAAATPPFKVLPGMLDLLPMENVSFGISPQDPRFAEQFPSGRLLTPTIYTSGTQQSIVVRWQLPIPQGKGQVAARAEQAKKFADWLTTSGMYATPTYTVRTKSSSFASLKASKILDTQVVTDLKGTGDTVGVARHEIDKFSQRISTSLRSEVIENPDAPMDSREIQNTLIKYSQVKSLDENAFNKQASEHMFDSRDIEPDVIEKLLNKSFERDQSGKSWKKSASFDGSANASVLDIVKAGGDTKATWSDEGMENMLRERGISTDFTGKRIVVKTIEVYFLKTSTLAASSDSLYIYSRLSGPSTSLPGVALNLFEWDRPTPNKGSKTGAPTAPAAL